MEEQANTNKENGSSKVGLAIIGIIVIAVIGVIAYQSQSQNQTQTAAVQQSTPAVTNAEQAGSTETAPKQAGETSEYKDGTYTAVGKYTSPGGQEELGVTLTIADGVVTTTEVEVKATRPTSVERQTDFAANYAPMVEGKNIDEISLTKVSGSSLSPKGFNDAVAQIKKEAQS